MIPIVDLTPESCRRRLGRRSQIQWWVTAYVVTLALAAVVSATLSLSQQREQSRVDSLLRQVQLDEDQQRRADELLAEIDGYERTLNRHRRLAWPFQIGDVVATIGATAPAEITLTTLAIKPRARSNRARTKEQANAQAEYEALYVELAGIAPDDRDIAEFVARLQRLDIFTTVVMDYARKTRLGVGEAREFGVTCEIDLNIILELKAGVTQ